MVLDFDKKMEDNTSDNEKWGKKGFEQGGGQGSSESSYTERQENLSNRGYQEDQPEHPIRSTGSLKPDQESMPTGEPDASDL